MIKIELRISLTISRTGNEEENGNDKPVLTDFSWRRRRKQVARRDNFICSYCGKYTRDGHVDHVVPLSKGGDDSLSNLVWACRACNLSKRDQTLEEWREADMVRQRDVQPRQLIGEDGAVMAPALKAFYDEATDIGTSIRIWEPEIGRDRYILFRDTLIGHGLASWNSYKRDGSPNLTQGWKLNISDEIIQPGLEMPNAIME